MCEEGAGLGFRRSQRILTGTVQRAPTKKERFSRDRLHHLDRRLPRELPHSDARRRACPGCAARHVTHGREKGGGLSSALLVGTRRHRRLASDVVVVLRPTPDTLATPRRFRPLAPPSRPPTPSSPSLRLRRRGCRRGRPHLATVCPSADDAAAVRSARRGRCVVPRAFPPPPPPPSARSRAVSSRASLRALPSSLPTPAALGAPPRRGGASDTHADAPRRLPVLPDGVRDLRQVRVRQPGRKREGPRRARSVDEALESGPAAAPRRRRHARAPRGARAFPSRWSPERLEVGRAPVFPRRRHATRHASTAVNVRATGIAEPPPPSPSPADHLATSRGGGRRKPSRRTVPLLRGSSRTSSKTWPTTG